ncbi:MAG: EAL domain-containing protein [Proteobacteria bacterium]|jgi:diguanylate cyclase (GGDEF)-like protein/PAS domain S-box-containing protein|nr:EAL domain-containing protein [Pseudomonadota bacterium]
MTRQQPNPFPHKLRVRLVALSLGIEMLMLGLLLANSLRLLNQAMEEVATTQVEEVVPLLDASLSSRLFEQDHAAIMEIINRLLNSPEAGLAYIVVYDSLGDVYAKGGNVNVQQMPNVDMQFGDALNDSIYDVAAELKLEGVPVGKVRFGLSVRSFLRYRNSILNQGLMIASGEILLSFLLLGLIGYFLTRHIYELLTATQRITSGEYSHKIPVQSRDEIGRLADNFNQMAQAVNDRVRALRESEHALFTEKEKVEVTLSAIADGVITTDISGRVEYINPAAENLVGFSLEEVKGEHIESIIRMFDENTFEPINNMVLDVISSGQPILKGDSAVLINRYHDEFSIEKSIAPIFDHNKNCIGSVMVLHDVTNTRQLTRQMIFQATHDSLTELVNRREFEARLSNYIDEVKQNGRRHVVLYLDLDQFKIVNDTSGHLAGDELLRQVSLIMKPHIRGSDVLARLGGDEFGVILLDCDVDHAIRVGEILRKSIEDFVFVWQKQNYRIGVSIGVVEVTEDNSDMNSVLSAADMACYAAKENGRNQIHVYHFEDKSHERKKDEMYMSSLIKQALEKDGFVLHAQRIVPIAADSDLPEMYELLLRMVDKENNELIPPQVVISSAERYQLMPNIDRWVVANALNCIQTCQKITGNEIFAINLSGQSLGQRDFLSDIMDSIVSSKINPAQLCFEITETHAIGNLTAVTRFITRMKDMGCRFSLDDFGSGLSSFAYLQNLPVDYIKIDGGFVRRLVENPIDRKLVESINNIGKVMGITTIAEYVENEEILAILHEIGVDYAQGFAVHRPSPDVFTELVKSGGPLGAENVPKPENVPKLA